MVHPGSGWSWLNKKFKATTNSAHDLPVAPNLLGQKFEVDGPAKVLGTDITYIPTGEGWLYLAGVKDFGSMEIVGYAMGARMTKDLVQVALEKALRYRRPEAGCIHHSDRGSHCCAHAYQGLIEKSGMRASMSRGAFMPQAAVTITPRLRVSGAR